MLKFRDHSFPSTYFGTTPIFRDHSSPLVPPLIRLIGGRAAARPIADMYEDHDAVKFSCALTRLVGIQKRGG